MTSIEFLTLETSDVAGVDPDGTGSRRIVVGGGAGPFTDPDGFVWEAASF